MIGEKFQPKTIVVAGLPGVGKTTVLAKAMERLKAKGYRAEVVNYGDFMIKVLAREGIKSRDELRHLPLSKQREIQALVAKEIRKYIEAKLGGKEEMSIAFVDTHVLIKTDTGLWPGLPEYVVKELKPDTIVLIEASPEEIVSRQLRDTTRYRADYANVGLVHELMNLMRSFAIASATFVGASVNFILNKEGKADEAADSLVRLIERL